MRVWAPLVQTKTGAVSGNGLGDHRDSPSVALGFSPPAVVPGKSQLGGTKMRRLVETGAAGNPCPEALVLVGPPGPQPGSSGRRDAPFIGAKPYLVGRLDLARKPARVRAKGSCMGRYVV